MSDQNIKTFPCKNCGADLEFKPGTNSLKCPYCSAENEITAVEVDIQELDYTAYLQKQEKDEKTEERITLNCESCGAQISLDKNITGDECPFCGSKVVAQERSVKVIKPESLLPFQITKEQAADYFKKWLKKRWFAPNKVKKFARMDGLNGIYAPYWTYDCQTTTEYKGRRGEYYYTTESYTTEENGQTVTKTRQVRHTNWYSAAGRVQKGFDDVLVMASGSLPAKIAEKLTPWDMENLVPYSENYLSGFRVESYSTGLAQGFENAKIKMDPLIRMAVEQDIGGDEQIINTMNVTYRDITFKHLLLPIWISAFKFKDKVYRFLVNARTGEVQGERPWSWLKIVFAALAAAAVIGTVITLFLMYRNGR